jgi:hypothetical protein
MANQVEIFNVDFGDTLNSIEKLKAELKETRKLFEQAKPNTAEFTKYSAEVKRLDGTIKTLNSATKENQNQLGGINTAAKFAAGSYGELKQKISAQTKALNELTVGTDEFNNAQEELIKLQEQRIVVEKKIPSLFQERIKGALDESNSLKQLRADLKAAQSAALNGDGAAAQRVAELKDKIDDLKDSTQTLQGSGVERLNTSMGKLTEGFTNFDSDKIKTGFKGIGSAMSAIPIILIIEGIKALIENFDVVVKFAKNLTDSFSDTERAVKDLTLSTEKDTIANKTLISQYTNEIALLTAKGGSEKELTELKKKKLLVEIEELQNNVRLRYAKVQEVIANDDLSESILRLSIAAAKKIGADKLAEQGEKQLAKDKKERYKEDLDAFRESTRQVEDAKTGLQILDIEYNKKQVESAKQTSSDKLQIAKEEQARLADIENAAIDREEQRVKDSLERQKQAAAMSIELEKQLIEGLEQQQQQYYIDQVALADANLLDVQRNGTHYLEAQLQLLNAEREQELSNTELTQAQRAEIINKYREQEFQLNQKYYSDNLQAAGNLTNSLGDLSNSLFDLKRSNLQKGSEEDKAAAKKQFEVNKAFGITTALIQGAVAVINASASVPYLPVGLAASIAATATTAATVAKISSTQFQYFDGGFTSKGNPHGKAQKLGNAQFHNDEYVVPSKVKNNPVAIPHITALESMRKGYPKTNISGFFDGGFTNRSASANSLNNSQFENQITSIIANMKAPVVKVTDINNMIKSGEVGVNVASL